MENRLLDISIYESEFLRLYKDLNLEERKYAINYINNEVGTEKEYLNELTNEELLKCYSDAVHSYNKDMNGL